MSELSVLLPPAEFEPWLQRCKRRSLSCFCLKCLGHLPSFSQSPFASSSLTDMLHSSINVDQTGLEVHLEPYLCFWAQVSSFFENKHL